MPLLLLYFFRLYKRMPIEINQYSRISKLYYIRLLTGCLYENQRIGSKVVRKRKYIEKRYCRPIDYNETNACRYDIITIPS